MMMGRLKKTLEKTRENVIKSIEVKSKKVNFEAYLLDDVGAPSTICCLCTDIH